ncbi:nucleotidyltransferase domain-containing protein [Conexibacter sp. S30A1]|uniref:nucleotidyltransferase domain-containing protein n=1 Tax=Conexibacter sp. S30A1 TaxID=2937800 RepID=UPI00200D8274|nr:hypothetical protein [Conexibacter sp. S30A1]
MDLDAWDAWTPVEVAARLDGVGPWAVAGGWAIDLFVGFQSREHEDLEVVTSRGGLALFQSAMPELEWYAAHAGEVTAVSRTPGILRPTWQTWGWDAPAGKWRLDVMRETWVGGRWAYRRNPAIDMPLDAALHKTASHIPFLAPEIVLLFKAKHSRDKDRHDFELVLPRLTDAQANWLARALSVEDPSHAWLRELQR